jgi:hypothetical protein
MSQTGPPKVYCIFDAFKSLTKVTLHGKSGFLAVTNHF